MKLNTTYFFVMGGDGIQCLRVVAFNYWEVVNRDPTAVIFNNFKLLRQR